MLFERIGLSERPLLDRIEQSRNRIDFGAVLPLVEQAPRVPTEPHSPIAGMFEPGFAPTGGEAMDAISKELVQYLKGDDELSKDLFLRWNSFREELAAFFDARKSAARKALEETIQRLTSEGRTIIDRIADLRNQLGSQQSWYNSCEELAAPERATLMGIRSSNPDNDPDSFALPGEREQWRRRLREAEDVVEARNEQMRPIGQKIQSLTSEIQAAQQQLEQIRQQRKAKRLELATGRQHDASSGLNGGIIL
ncbi:MAG TPA: hypothetical protein VMD25_13505 [Acidobacteriaceae bacterium]|nr:hypothetical protein [Acidobacteriaceae bacterium]